MIAAIQQYTEQGRLSVLGDNRLYLFVVVDKYTVERFLLPPLVILRGADVKVAEVL